MENLWMLVQVGVTVVFVYAVYPYVLIYCLYVLGMRMYRRRSFVKGAKLFRLALRFGGGEYTQMALGATYYQLKFFKKSEKLYARIAQKEAMNGRQAPAIMDMLERIRARTTT